jgi:hypothetical protein
MTVRSFLLGLALCLLLCSTVLARSEHSVVHKRLTCGSFTAEATTDTGTTDDDMLIGVSQTIRLINRAKHIDRTLDLGQHRSPNPQLGGRASLDGIVSAAICVRATTGRVYLLLTAYCVNEGAHSCTTGKDASGAEWAIFYDAAGRRLVANPTGMTSREYQHLRTLGLGPAIDGGEPVIVSQDTLLFR